MGSLLRLWAIVGMAKVKTWEEDQVQQRGLLGHGSTYASQQQGAGERVVRVAPEGSLGRRKEPTRPGWTGLMPGASRKLGSVSEDLGRGTTSLQPQGRI